MRTLVTGADGFIGRWLCRHLEACGDQVVKATEEAGFDITDPQGVRGEILQAQPEVIYHLAQQGLVGESWKNPSATFAVNATGTLHVLDAALACDVPPRVVLLSSSDVYGNVPNDHPIAEDTQLAPVSPFAASKVAAEYLGVQAYLGTKLPVIRVRTFSRIGPDQGTHFVAPALAMRIIEASATAATTLVAGNLQSRRDYIDVRDEVRAYRLLAESGEPGEVYNVCSGHQVSVKELADRLLDIAHVNLDVEVDPKLLRAMDPSGPHGDASKLIAATGWHPEIKLDQSLGDVLRYRKEQ